MDEDKLKKRDARKINTGRINDLVKTSNKILNIFIFYS